jgi:hypothetical protein
MRIGAGLVLKAKSLLRLRHSHLLATIKMSDVAAPVTASLEDGYVSRCIFCQIAAQKDKGKGENSLT